MDAKLASRIVGEITALSDSCSDFTWTIDLKGIRISHPQQHTSETSEADAHCGRTGRGPRNNI